jgi:predicted dehydrogenase
MRVGVVGVKGIGQAHLWALRRVDGAALAAVCDIDGAAAAAAAEQHDVPAFTDAQALYDGGEVDAVVIATPPGTHVDLARAALAAGLHVYCEKPVAATCDDGYALAAEARGGGRVLQVGFQFRFHKGYAALRAAVDELGAPRRVSLTATNWFRAQQYFRASPWRATWLIAGGGVLMSQAIHQLDALVATAGMPSAVFGYVRRAEHRAEVEDVAHAELEWRSGMQGHLTASLNEPAGEERFEVVCERGAVRLVDGYDVRVARHDEVRRIVDDCPDEFPEQAVPWEQVDVPRSPGEWFEMLVDAHRDFAAAIEHRRPPVVDGDTGTLAVELANAIYLSSCLGEPVDLPLRPGMYPPVFEDLASGRRVLRS